MAEILVVEDSPDQALLIAALLEKSEHSATVVESGAAALDQIEAARPDLVVTDLMMPGMDGLELVEAVRTRYADLPVLLVTAFGSGEIAVEALKKGAASYVPKQRLVDDLPGTVENVLALARETRRKTHLLESLVESRFRFVLPNEENLIPGLVDFLQDRICYRNPDCDENLLMQVGIAVQEAIRNAMHHGNLEVSSELRQKSVALYNAKVEERLADDTYSGRRVTVAAVFTGQDFRCAVRDEGPGFDSASIPDPTDPENLLKTSGRGMYLISMFMDSVGHSDSGTEIVMTKNLAGSD
ncbi:MAG: response regulator [bacterium]|nr:response regulator [bacterium]